MQATIYYQERLEYLRGYGDELRAKKTAAWQKVHELEQRMAVAEYSFALREEHSQATLTAVWFDEILHMVMIAETALRQELQPSIPTSP